jgi:hypothetical protein
VNISATAKDLVTGIGTGWTGSSDTDGVKIVYGVVFDFDKLVTSDESITVTYTLTEGAGPA